MIRCPNDNCRAELTVRGMNHIAGCSHAGVHQLGAMLHSATGQTVASCTCGWQSLPRDEQIRARTDWVGHVSDELG